LLVHLSLGRGDALDIRDVHLHSRCAPLVVRCQGVACPVKGGSVSTRQDDDEAFREQLARRLESKATIRASHERDAGVVGPHGGILTATLIRVDELAKLDA
jgi:hypothetical protein